MAKAIVAALPLSRNDISILARLFEVSFDDHIHHDSPFFTEYLCSLRTLIGLGHTASLVYRGVHCIYYEYMDTFVKRKEGNFKECPGSKTLLAQYSAEMVGTAVCCFHWLGYPRYYEDFLKAFHKTMPNVSRL